MIINLLFITSSEDKMYNSISSWFEDRNISCLSKLNFGRNKYYIIYYYIVNIYSTRLLKYNMSNEYADLMKKNIDYNNL